jgi:RNA polymerase sigma-70 factor (ECF subfamily)
MPVSDRTLVARARAGDVHAFGVLLERHRPALERACRHRRRDRGLAADVAQDAALTAWLQLERLQDPSRFGAWLAGIGRVLSLRALRELGGLRELPTSDGAVADGPGSARDDPAARVLAAERAAELAGAIAALPPRQRDAVVLSTSPTSPSPRSPPASAPSARGCTRRAPRCARDSPPPRSSPCPTSSPPPSPTSCARPPGATSSCWTARARSCPSGSDARRPRRSSSGCRASTCRARAAMRSCSRLLATAGERPAGVRITRFSGGVFHAEVRLAGGAAVDARPSDALVLAVSSGVPIEVDAAVLRATADGPPDAYAGDLAQAEPGGAGRIAVELRRQLAELEAELAAVRDDR